MPDASLTAVGKSALVWLSSALFFGPSFFFIFPPPSYSNTYKTCIVAACFLAELCGLKKV
jgi:hypothetical protein